jgi:hypothetical protein
LQQGNEIERREKKGAKKLRCFEKKDYLCLQFEKYLTELLYEQAFSERNGNGHQERPY